MRMYRFTFPRVSDGFREYTIDTLDVVEQNERKARWSAVEHLKERMGAAKNAVTPEEAVKRAKIKLISKSVIVLKIGCDQVVKNKKEPHEPWIGD